MEGRFLDFWQSFWLERKIVGVLRGIELLGFRNRTRTPSTFRPFRVVVCMTGRIKNLVDSSIVIFSPIDGAVLALIVVAAVVVAPTFPVGVPPRFDKGHGTGRRSQPEGGSTKSLGGDRF